LQITYTVTNPVNIPPGTTIRLELSTIDNSANPNASYKVTVTTKRPAGTTIDGPTPSIAYKIKQIGTEDIAPDSLFIFETTRPGSVVNVPQAVTTATASCAVGEELVGGGHVFTADNAFDVRYLDSFVGAFDTWNVRAINAGTGAMTLQAFASCIPSAIP
jgi:hypothetical protein